MAIMDLKTIKMELMQSKERIENETGSLLNIFLIPIDIRSMIKNSFAG